MDDRKIITQELDFIEQAIRTVEIAYEQYFMGIEKRPPEKERGELHKRINRLANRRIMQTELRFRYQNLATRFHSYANYWDRILRLMDEGKYSRQLHKIKFAPPPEAAGPATQPAPSPPRSEIDELYEQLHSAQRSGQLGGGLPDRGQLASFLEKQRAAIREKVGDREIEFFVAHEDGRAKIKARPKK